MIADESFLKAHRDYLHFLDDEEDKGVYYGRVKDAVAEGKRRVVVNINDLKRKFPERVDALRTSAEDEMSCFNRALNEYIATIQSDMSKNGARFHIALDGCFGDRYLSPRTLTSKFIGSILCVEGIVTKVSLVKPQILHSVHYCPTTGKISERKYTEMMNAIEDIGSNVYPTKDDNGNILETEFGLCVYRDYQTIALQEKPENSPAGQLPRSVDIVCEDDLVDQCKPGDRVKIVACYRCLPNKNNGYTAGTFNAVLVANNICHVTQDAEPSLTREELNACKKIAKDRRVFELLSKSLAPSIHGQEYIKKAILCLLLGGTEKKLFNGSRLRGDINILLIGDPSVAKSQLLRYVLLIAPRAIPTTGRGSSGVGLTAAITTDPESGEKKLEAGAMVLADRGVVCIDEFDKMSDIDRTAIHEAMEQGRVTISKAGVHVALNARCSVLAAANPVYGKYDQRKTPMENIGLQDSLLSRFDLLFIMLDKTEKEHDKIVAEHVVNIHRYRDPLEHDGEVTSRENVINNDFAVCGTVGENITETNIYERNNVYLSVGPRTRRDELLSIDFMRKYIHIARSLSPKLTERACEIICNEYSRLRTQETGGPDMFRTQPITVRTLETLIRLATAHAKARLSNTVAPQDAEQAIELVKYATFQNVTAKKRKRSIEPHPETKTETDSVSVTSQPIVASDTKRSKTNEMDTEDISAVDVSRKSQLPSESKTPSETKTGTSTISVGRLESFKTSLHKCFRELKEQSLQFSRLVDFISTTTDYQFSEDEINAALIQMSEENQIMYVDDVIFLI